MVENLRPNERDYEKETNEGKDKLNQLDSRQKNIKDLILEEAMRYGNSEDDIDMQKVIYSKKLINAHNN